MTGESNISFVTATVQLQSRHDVELQHAAVRSHNARLAAARRKTRTGSIPQRSRHFGSNTKSKPKKSESSQSQPRIGPRSQDDAAAIWECDHSPDLVGTHALVVRSPSSKENPWIPSPWHWSKGTRVDDFECIPGSSSGVAPVSIDFLLWLAGSPARSSNDVFSERGLLEQMAMCEDLFHVVVATMSGIHCALASPEKSPVKELFVHRERALSLMRKRLLLPNAATDDSMILSVLIMALMELGTENRIAFEVHHKHIKLMIAARGRIEGLKVPKWIQSTIRRFGLWNSPELFSKTTNRTDVCTYSVNPPSIEYVYWLAVLPEGIRNVAMLLVLSNQTLHVVDRIAKRERCAKTVDASEAQALQDAEWLEDLKDALPALNLRNDSKGAPLDKLLCLALLQHCLNKSDSCRLLLSSAFSNITASLLHEIPRAHIPANIRFRHCLIWIWLVAFQATTNDLDFGDLKAEGSMLLRLLPDKFPETKRWAAADFIGLVRKFFWTQKLERVICTNVNSSCVN